MTSSTTSLLNSCRNANANRATRMQASGSSPFTWKIGAWIIRATSVQYIEERDSVAAAMTRRRTTYASDRRSENAD